MTAETGPERYRSGPLALAADMTDCPGKTTDCPKSVDRAGESGYT